ncbi:MAG: glycosyl hydrolase 43 family protein [Ferruginibacter sp.]|nr:glycosyl hydrolase 43 family protein [Ferruginibacter sp.]
MNCKRFFTSSILLSGIFLLIIMETFAQDDPKVWSADNGDGSFTNPVLHLDYSDPDAIRVGNDFYMVASSFNAIPGLPILHSSDLVNWSLIAYALPRQTPAAIFEKVQHGKGVWAPSIRFHNDEFYIYFPDPDQGIFLTKAKDIRGPWSAPLLIQAGKGLIDPCPLWDTNGKAYLVHAFAGSRAGFKSIIAMQEMTPSGDSLIGEKRMVYDGHQVDPTIEGPKIYKRNNYYYIFAPAGGVSTGWQLVLRSRNIYGPYERQVVMVQGNTSVNGPHQGAWVNTVNGEDWFLHFQDKDAYGRIVHLQPMIWKNDWPIIGSPMKNDSKGEPVLRYKKPGTKVASKISAIPVSDEFNESSVGLQWQWQANPQYGWAFRTSEGYLRMFCLAAEDSMKNYWPIPNLLLQKLPAEKFTATTRMECKFLKPGDRAGLIMFGLDYALISAVKTDSGTFISYQQCVNAEKNTNPRETLVKKLQSTTVWFRMNVDTGAICKFSFSEDGINFMEVSPEFTARPGKWVGAKLGFLCTTATRSNDAGFINIDWIRFIKN